MNINELIKKVVKLENITELEAREVTNQLMKGEFKSSQIGALLTALSIKGETNEEILGFAKGLRDNMVSLNFYNESLIDTCGTGGDGLNTFNVSTAVSFVAAAAGIKVAKHGNRALSSKCGSADVLAELGVNINLSKIQVEEALDKVGIAFLFAPTFHSAMKNISNERQEIGIRTIFNLVGPLVNPAKLNGQLVGVFNKDIQRKVCEALRDLGLKKVLVVHGENGLDEISISGDTFVCELKNGEIIEYIINPKNYGLGIYPIDKIKGGECKENAQIIKSIFEGEIGARRDMVILNSAAALYVGGKVKDINTGVSIAREMIDKKLAKQKLDELISYCSNIKGC